LRLNARWFSAARLKDAHQHGTAEARRNGNGVPQGVEKRMYHFSRSIYRELDPRVVEDD